MVERDDDARRAQVDDTGRAREARLRRDAEVRDADRKALQQRRDDQTKANTEAMRRQDESQPTPTQEENDLARLGQPVLNKEDDGSGPDRIPNPALTPEQQKRLADEDEKRRAAEASGGNAPYRTRASEPAKPAASKT